MLIVTVSEQLRSNREWARGLARKLLRSPLAAWLVAFLGTALSIWLQLESDRIRIGLVAFSHAFPKLWLATPDLRTISFWAGCACWAWLLGARLRIEDQQISERDDAMQRSFQAWPGQDSLRLYASRFFSEVRNALGPFVLSPPDAGISGQDRALELGRTIVQALETIAELAQTFSKVNDASYGANIMLVATPEDFPSLRGSVQFVVDRETMDGAKGLLYLPEALLLRNRSTQPHRDITCIALPFPNSATTESGANNVIPGAPAAIHHANSVLADTHAITRECPGVHEEIRIQLRAYFQGGLGKDVRSFASFRLGTSANPVGVLNIDSNRPHVLGRNPVHYIAFYALLEPLLDMLRLSVQEYATVVGRPVSH